MDPLCFEELTVTADTSLPMMNIALRYVPVGIVLHSHGAPRHFYRHVPAFRDKEFSDL
jgi:hypothetical protein